MSQSYRIAESFVSWRSTWSKSAKPVRQGWAVRVGLTLIASFGTAAAVSPIGPPVKSSGIHQNVALAYGLTSKPVSLAPVHAHVDSDDLGILLGDSVARGFGGSPIYYNDQGPIFKRSGYRFVASADKPIPCLDGYKGIHKWLNRGVTANGSNATLARWSIDVAARLNRGSQTKRDRVRCVLVSTGFMDIAQGVLRHHLAESETNMNKNLLALVRRARKEDVRIAILEIPDPTRAPLGKRFHTVAGTLVVPFYEEQKLNPTMRREFTGAVLRYRSFLEAKLAAEGAEIVDYAGFLPSGYFWDSHHPSEPGYIRLGQLLVERYPSLSPKINHPTHPNQRDLRGLQVGTPSNH